MQSAQETTKERREAYLAALEHEKAGYEARLARLAAGKSDPRSKAELEELVKGVAAELARAKRGGKAKSPASEEETS